MTIITTPRRMHQIQNRYPCKRGAALAVHVTSVAGKRSSVTASSLALIAQSTVMVRTIFPHSRITTWSVAKLSICRVFVRPAFESPPESRTAVCRGPGKPTTKGRSPLKDRAPKCQPRRSPTRCTCHRTKICCSSKREASDRISQTLTRSSGPSARRRR